MTNCTRCSAPTTGVPDVDERYDDSLVVALRTEIEKIKLGELWSENVKLHKEVAFARGEMDSAVTNLVLAFEQSERHKVQRADEIDNLKLSMGAADRLIVLQDRIRLPVYSSGLSYKDNMERHKKRADLEKVIADARRDYLKKR